MLDRSEHSSLADRRADATREGIADAAWMLSRDHGLAGWSLRQLASTLDVKAPTLYAYVDSKHAIFDLMFRQGWEELGRIAEGWALTPDEEPRPAFKRAMRSFVESSVTQPIRYQLLFQRVVPGFEPSAASYEAAIAYYERFRAQMKLLGVTEQDDLDLWTAVSTGLINQQLANDPEGDRWTRLIDAAVDMFLDHLDQRTITNDMGGTP